MLSITGQNIVTEINAFMTTQGFKNSDWYVGIAAKPRNRLFVDHQVNEATDLWIYRTATTHTEAREIEMLYHKAGCKGSHGGGDTDTMVVYAYVIRPHTAE